MSPTIKDIALRAGVSYATVSRALNNHPEVSKATREKVLHLAKEMGYRPNAIARGLVTKETRTIGLVLPDITNPFFPEVARGVEEAASESGYSVFLCNTDWSSEREEEHLHALMQKQVDGFIVAPSSDQLTHLLKILDAGCKAVFISGVISHPNSVSIIIDNVRGAQMAVEHLLKKGHRQIGFVGGVQDVATNNERFLGYRKALESWGIGLEWDYIRKGDFRREGGLAVTKELLRLEERPTAIFAANDLTALGVLQAVKEERLAIPQDVAVVGFDDIQFASLPEIELTTIAQPKFQMGRLAFQKLLQINKEDGPAKERIILRPKLVVRKTS